MKKYPIKSFWQTETGRFDNELCAFVDRKFSETKEREIYVEYDPKTDIIHFRGGPTGYEAYNFNSLEESLPTFKHNTFCICAGTINSWPICFVNRKDFMEIFEKIKEERNGEDYAK